MFTKGDIKTLFGVLNNELKKIDKTGEILVVGGAAVSLVFDEKRLTRDIDAVFEPTDVIRKAIKKVTKEFNLPDNWINDAVKGYFTSKFTQDKILEYSNLRVYIPDTTYLLFMKVMAGRPETNDISDILLLLKKLKIKTLEQVLEVIEHYCPKHKVPARAQFLLEEIFSQKDG